MTESPLVRNLIRHYRMSFGGIYIHTFVMGMAASRKTRPFTLRAARLRVISPSRWTIRRCRMGGSPVAVLNDRRSDWTAVRTAVGIPKSTRVADGGYGTLRGFPLEHGRCLDRRLTRTNGDAGLDRGYPSQEYVRSSSISLAVATTRSAISVRQRSIGRRLAAPETLIAPTTLSVSSRTGAPTA